MNVDQSTKPFDDRFKKIMQGEEKTLFPSIDPNAIGNMADEIKRMKEFMMKRTIDGERTEWEVYCETKVNVDGNR